MGRGSLGRMSEPYPTLDLREQIARIDRSLDEAAKFRSERGTIVWRVVIWQVVAAIMGAALFGAGAACWKIAGG